MARSGFPTMIQLGLLEGTRSALKSNRPSTPCRQCSPRLRSREQERIRPSQNDRNCKDSPAINAAYSVLKGVNNMHFGLDLPRVGNRMAKAFGLFADPRITAAITVAAAVNCLAAVSN